MILDTDATRITRRAQILLMRRVALAALERYRLPEGRLRFDSHGENTTFRHDSVAGRRGRPQPAGPGSARCCAGWKGASSRSPPARDQGLIHADLHLGNALFHRGAVKLIDFDDCGHGARLYDLAIALWELRDEPDHERFRDALLDGYRAHRDIDVRHLDDYIAVRQVAFDLWYTGMAGPQASRVVSGLHYVPDVLAGAALGSVVVLLAGVSMRPHDGGGARRQPWRSATNSPYPRGRRSCARERSGDAAAPLLTLGRAGPGRRPARHQRRGRSRQPGPLGGR